MKPEEFLAQLQRMADRGELAANQARAAARSAMVGVRMPGQVVTASESVVRVSGPRAAFLARSLRAKGLRAARMALRRSIR